MMNQSILSVLVRMENSLPVVVSIDGFIFGQLLVENLFIPIVGQVVYSKYVGIQGETKLAHRHRMDRFQFSIYEDSDDYKGTTSCQFKKISHLSKKKNNARREF